MEQLSQKIKSAEKFLEQYAQIINRWQKALNLVSNHDLKNLWQRHIYDSAQLYFYLPKEARVLVDFGSGGGFPALVLAILNKHFKGAITDFYLIESDNKKCVFLQEAARELGVHVHILNERIENINNLKADVITARGFAKINRIIEYGFPFLKENTVFLLLKGKNVSEELKELDHSFVVNCKKGIHESCIVQISGVRKK